MIMTDSVPVMPVIPLNSAIPEPAFTFVPDRMGIVKPEHTAISPIMQGQAVADTVGHLQAWHHPAHLKASPVAAFHGEYFTIKR